MILGILGSASSDSLTRKGLMVVGAQVRESGMEFDFIDLQSEFRQLQNIDDYSSPCAGGQTARLRARFARGAGIILATPVYHGTFSGLLKNALDQLEGDAFQQMPVGILAAGGGPRSAAVACEHLRTVVRALGGWSTPTQVGLTYDDITDTGPSDGLLERIGEMVEEIGSFAFARRPIFAE